MTSAICRHGHFCRFSEKWRQKYHSESLVHIVVCGTLWHAASCDLRRRKIMSHGQATQMGGLIVVACVAKRVFWRQIGRLAALPNCVASGSLVLAKGCAWRRSPKFVSRLGGRQKSVLLATVRLLLSTEPSSPVCSANGFQPSRFERLDRPKALPLAAVRAGLRPTEAFALPHVARNKADALPN